MKYVITVLIVLLHFSLKAEGDILKSDGLLAEAVIAMEQGSAMRTVTFSIGDVLTDSGDEKLPKNLKAVITTPELSKILKSGTKVILQLSKSEEVWEIVGIWSQKIEPQANQ